jgi:predicted ATP-dependent serine protease
MEKQGTRESQGLSLVWAQDILQSEDEEVDSLWGGFLFPGSIHLLSGEAGVGKTTFLYNLAVKATKGQEFVGLPLPRPLRVLYLDLETPQVLRARKLRLVAEGQPIEGLAFLTTVNLERNLQELTVAVKEHGFDLVIVDTIGEAFHTENEDDNAEANRQMTAVRQLVTATGCAVILVHHIGKGGQSKGVHKARGASARAASADVVLNLESRSEDVICLEMVKNRWVGGVSKLPLRKIGEDLFEVAELVGEETVPEKFKAQESILEMLDGDSLQAKDIVAKGREQGFSESTVKRALSDLVQLGKVDKPGRGVYARR